MALDLKQALTKLSRSPNTKLFFAFCEKGSDGKPVVVAHTKPIQAKDLEEFEEIPEAFRSKMARGTMKVADKKLLLAPKGGKSISEGTLESKVLVAVKNAKASSLVESVSVGAEADDSEFDEKPVPAPKPYPGKKFQAPLAANPKLAELLAIRKMLVEDRDKLDADDPKLKRAIDEKTAKIRQINATLAKFDIPAAGVKDDKPLKSKPLDANYKDEDKKFAWRAENVTEVSDGAGGKRRPTPEDIAKIREKTHLKTKYYTEEEKKAGQVTIDSRGGAQDASGRALQDEKHGFVMDPDTKQLHTFKEAQTVDAQGTKLNTHHSSPLAGKAVAGAGHIQTKSGRVVSIDDASGHYKPSAELTWQVVRELGKQGATLDTSIVDADGDPIDPARWNAANGKLAKAKPLLEKYDKERKRISAILLKPSAASSEQEVAKLKGELDANAKNFEKLTDAIKGDAELVRGSGPANKPADVELQGKQGLSQEEFDKTRGDVKKINALLRTKLKVNRDILPDGLDPKTLNSRPALNLKIGELTKLRLTTQQFEQTEGNEKQARLKAAVTGEIDAKRRAEKEQKRLAKQAAKPLSPLQQRLKQLGFEGDKDGALISLGVDSGALGYIASDMIDDVIFGRKTGADAVEEMIANGKWSR
jgi:hypothetical protein